MEFDMKGVRGMCCGGVSRYGVLVKRCISVALLLVAGCVQPADVVAPPVVSRADEVASFKPLKPERWTLDNGLTVLFVHDHELPLVQGKLFIRGGSLWGPTTPVGAVSAMGELMRQGGAGPLSAENLDKELQKLAASVTSSFGAEFGAVGFSSLATDFDRVFELAANVVKKPRFEADRIALWKGQALEGIRRRNEDPGTVASIAFTQLLYGDTPYGRVSVDKDVQSLSRSQLVALHREFVCPDGAILMVTGRISKEEVAAAVERQFGSWQRRGYDLPPAPPVSYQPKPGIYFVSMPFTQATVEMGQLGLPRLTPDYPAIDIFNEVFGSSGFGSRLMKRVRTELGLSYGIYGGIAPAVVKGTNYIFLQTKLDSVGAAVAESLQVLDGLQRQPPTEEELIEKKTALKNSFVFNFDSPAGTVLRQARLELLRYPGDYDESYLPKITAVSGNAVQEVARVHWDPKQFVVVVVGGESAYSNLQREVQRAGSPVQGWSLQRVHFDKVLTLPK
jgi:zinc protease